MLLVLVTVAAFSEVRHAEFVLWDDNVNVFENPYLQSVTLQNVLRFWRQPYYLTYLPVTYTAWALLASFAHPPALYPQAFHLANLAVHAVNALLVFAIVRMLVGKDWPACAGALLFALHPVQVEPVAWVSGMKDLLGGLLSLLALWQYLCYATAARDESTRRRVRAHYALATAFFLLALLAKSSAAALPVIGWVLDRWALGRPARQPTLALAGWLVPAAGSAVLLQFLDPLAAGLSTSTALWVRPLVAGDAFAFYLYKLFAPLDLSPDYARTVELGLQQRWLYFTWLAPVGLAGLLWLGRHRVPWVPVCAAVFVAGLLPVLGLIPIPFQEFSTVADRYLYLAMLGPALALAWLLARHQGRAIRTLCVAALVLLGVQSALQTLHWQNTLVLFRHALAVSPNSLAAHINLGAAFQKEGKTALAIAHFREAVRVRPGAVNARVDLGHVLYRAGMIEEAAIHFRQAVRLRPEMPQPHDYLAVALAALGRSEEAETHWEEALRLEPNYAPAHHNLAVTVYVQGRSDEAIAHWREALRIVPDYAEAQRGLTEALQAQAQERPQEQP